VNESTSELSQQAAPLAGVRVLDLSRVLAGPLCTQRLADLGADVIKIERPGTGDETRSWGPPYQGGVASYFLSLNRGKRSFALDLATPEGHKIVVELCGWADVVIHNFRSGTAARLGLSSEQLEETNPRLICLGINGFGSDRKPVERPGYDLIVEAESGLMSVTGSPEREPQKVGVAIVDVLTGLESTNAILAALHGREQSGRGASIEVSLLDSALAGLVNVAQGTIATGKEATRFGNAHPSIVPYDSFETADAPIVVAAANDGLWARFCAAVGLDDLVVDERFVSNPDRVRNRVELTKLLDERFKQRKAEQWIEALRAADVPAGRVFGVHAGITAAAESGRAATVRLGEGDDPVEVIAPPARFNGQMQVAQTPPPSLGQHTDEILVELGRDQAAITKLRSDGIVG